MASQCISAESSSEVQQVGFAAIVTANDNIYGLDSFKTSPIIFEAPVTLKLNGICDHILVMKIIRK